MKFTLSRLLLIVFYAAIVIGVLAWLGVPDFAMVKDLLSKDGNVYPKNDTIGSVTTAVLCGMAAFLSVAAVLCFIGYYLQRLWDWTAYGEWHVSSDPYEWSAGDLAPFNVLALGTRFKYDNPEVEYTFVKISHTEIARWDDDEVITNWVGQLICSFADNDDEISLSEKVILVEQ